MGAPSVRFSVYIPARFASTRLPGKLLLPIDGRPIIEWTCRQALASGASKVVVATDDERIAEVVRGSVEVRLTAGEFHSGTDRIAAAVAANADPDETLIVNVQGDEPFLPPAVIAQVAQALADDGHAVMASVCEPFLDPTEVLDPHNVKVVRDQRDRALYFSRAPIPWDRSWEDRRDPELIRQRLDGFRRHVGLYAYRAGYLRQFVRYPQAPLERIELLEQLRVLHYGGTIIVPEAIAHAGAGIDTAEDLERARRRRGSGLTARGR